jgi:hypothetical protein
VFYRTAEERVGLCRRAVSAGTGPIPYHPGRALSLRGTNRSSCPFPDLAGRRRTSRVGWKAAIGMEPPDPRDELASGDTNKIVKRSGIG